MKVYLAGPINGCTDNEANNWRDVVKREIGDDNCLDPMRRDYRGREHEHVTEIVELDKLDITSSDVVLANCSHASWGTAMELHYAWLHGIRVLAVVPPDKPVSPWLRYHTEVYYSLGAAMAEL